MGTLDVCDEAAAEPGRVTCYPGVAGGDEPGNSAEVDRDAG